MRKPIKASQLWLIANASKNMLDIKSQIVKYFRSVSRIFDQT